MATAVRYLWEYGTTEDGNYIGTSSSKIGFYGTAPTAKQSLTVTTVATTVSVSTTSAIWGFSTSSQANQIIVAVKELLEIVATVGIAG
jgi:hypothetical protein